MNDREKVEYAIMSIKLLKSTSPMTDWLSGFINNLLHVLEEPNESARSD